MNKNSTIFGVLAGLGTGAAAMYFLDPDRGTRRRAIAADKFRSSARRVSQSSSASRKDLANRGRGLWIETKHLFDRSEAPDAVVEQRIRSKIGRVVSYPHWIRVSANHGKIKLSGQIVADEIPKLLRSVKRVPGVNEVVTWLETRNSVSKSSAPNKEMDTSIDAVRPPQTVH